MISKIILRNFKSFKNETVIDFTKTNYAILPRNIADNGILKGTIFLGANASGKSNAILGIKLLLDFLFQEREVNSGLFKCLFGESNTYSIDYYFVIQDKKVRYYYENNIQQRIITENLYVDGNLMLERMGVTAKSYMLDDKVTMYDEQDIDKDTLFLRTLYFNTKFAGNEVLKKWIEFLGNSVYINAFNRTVLSYGKEDVSLLTYLQNEGTEHLNKFFDKYNFEQQIEYAKESQGHDILLRNAEDEKTIFFKRRGVDVPIPYSEESLGNKNLLHMLPAFLEVINKGGILLIDEFSSGFHNELEELLVRYFMENANNSQLLFVSHSTNLLSNTILRPDQEYTVEFNGDKGSSVKRFSDEQPRSAQNIEKMYISGVFGGLPNYKDAYED